MTNLAGIMSDWRFARARRFGRNRDHPGGAEAAIPEAFERLVRTYDQSVPSASRSTCSGLRKMPATFTRKRFCACTGICIPFAFDCAFHTWLYRIVTNICLDHLRKRKVRREESAILDTARRGQSIAWTTWKKPPRMPTPNAPCTTTSWAGASRQHSKNLTPRERVVFELRHYQGLRLKGIGEVLGTSEEAAKNCLFRATQKDAIGIGGSRMKCQQVKQAMPLYYYGELPPEQEENVETHCAECDPCGREIDRSYQPVCRCFWTMRSLEPSLGLAFAECRELLARPRDGVGTTCPCQQAIGGAALLNWKIDLRVARGSAGACWRSAGFRRS